MMTLEPEFELDYAYNAWLNGRAFDDETALSLKLCRLQHKDFGKEINNEKYPMAFRNYVGKRIQEVKLPR